MELYITEEDNIDIDWERFEKDPSLFSGQTFLNAWGKAIVKNKPLPRGVL